jgi:hypothetical protein
VCGETAEGVQGMMRHLMSHAGRGVAELCSGGMLLVICFFSAAEALFQLRVIACMLSAFNRTVLFQDERTYAVCAATSYCCSCCCSADNAKHYTTCSIAVLAAVSPTLRCAAL